MKKESKISIFYKTTIVVTVLTLTVIGSNPAYRSLVGEQTGWGNVVLVNGTTSSEKVTVNTAEVQAVGGEHSALPKQLTYVAPPKEINVEEPTQSLQEVLEEEPDFTVEEMTAVKYANKNSNVRSGPAKEYERIGGVSINHEVQVTGRASTGWYRISYNGAEGYIAGNLLSDEPVVIPQPESEQPQPQEQPAQQEAPAVKQKWEYTEDELVAIILSQIITPGMDGFQIATAVNNYLCATVEYDDTYTRHSTYEALAYGSGVCQAYANAFWRLMNAAGVQTDYVSGYGWTGTEWGRHGWNRTLINGVYYYTDVTWNDSLGSNYYLLISYDEMSRDHYELEINRKREM